MFSTDKQETNKQIQSHNNAGCLKWYNGWQEITSQVKTCLRQSNDWADNIAKLRQMSDIHKWSIPCEHMSGSGHYSRSRLSRRQTGELSCWAGFCYCWSGSGMFHLQVLGTRAHWLSGMWRCSASACRQWCMCLTHLSVEKYAHLIVRICNHKEVSIQAYRSWVVL